MSNDSKDETYTLGYGEGSMEWMTSRTAESHGAFLLPYLKPGMRFLDCGCGPGTLTMGFAQRVAPGETIGIDRETSQTGPIAADARAASITNLEFARGDVYRLPWPDASFDVTFGSAVLGSVTDAERVVREMLRVLRPGGIIGLKEFDNGGDLIWPHNPIIDRSIELYQRVRAANGHEANAGRKLKSYLRSHGCDIRHLRAVYDQYWHDDQLIAYVERNIKLIDENLATQYLQHGWATPEELREEAEEWRRFASDPGAIYMCAWVETVGIKQ